MAIFGSSDEKRLKYLEEEREKLWTRIASLENSVSELKDLISKKTTDYEKEARQASKKTSEFRNRTEDAKNKAYEHIKNIEKIVNETKDFKSSFIENKTQIEEALSTSNQNRDIIEENRIQAVDNLQTIEDRMEKLNEIIKENNDLPSKMEEFQQLFDEIQDIHNKFKVPYKEILQKKQDINSVFYEIMGYDEKSDEGDESHVDGLREKLEKTFEGLKEKLEGFDTKIEEHKNEKTVAYEKIKTTWENIFVEIRGRIESLLPQAMTAGLSSAYSDKRKNEIEESGKSYQNYLHAVFGLIAISLIPFGSGIYFLYTGMNLKQVLIDMPRLVVSILPLYIPVLWLACSANKKVNLSKRLIEEYTHKEVLAKTFEGLARQIEKIDNEEISKDLRQRLLINLLEVSSENPGKLISDYQKSDHPLMEALDKSIKLGNAVDRLSTVPGISRIASILDRRSKEILQQQNETIEKGLNQIDEESMTNDKELCDVCEEK